MLQRWKEAHKNFTESYPSEYYMIVGPYLFLDEYLNTVGQCFNFYPSEEQFKILQENLFFVQDSIIKSSPILNLEQKRNALRAKYAQDRDDFFSKTSKRILTKKIRWHSNRLRINSDNLSIELLRGLSKNLFNLEIKLGKFYNIVFSIGSIKF